VVAYSHDSMAVSYVQGTIHNIICSTTLWQ